MAKKTQPPTEAAAESKEAVKVDGATAAAQPPTEAAAPVLSAEPRRVFVDFELGPDQQFRAQGWYNGGPGSVLSDWSDFGGGRVMVPVGVGIDVRVQVQTAALDGKRSGWIEAGTIFAPKPNNGGLTTPPTARK